MHGDQHTRVCMDSGRSQAHTTRMAASEGMKGQESAAWGVLRATPAPQSGKPQVTITVPRKGLAGRQRHRTYCFPSGEATLPTPPTMQVTGALSHRGCGHSLAWRFQQRQNYFLLCPGAVTTQGAERLQSF